ncbi:MAG: BON domain-containing protein [Succinivibrio sp.]|nr:BON domain-containing protein [Succinivibrio sp.]
MALNEKLSKLALVLALAAAPLYLNGCVTAMVGATAAGAGAAVGSDSRTVDTMMYDEQIRQDTNAILTDHRSDTDDKVWHVSASSFNGNVLLTGQTTSWSYFQSRLPLIRKVEYVRKVYNYVENRAPLEAKDIAADSFITSKVKSALLLGKDISSGRFKVITENRVVYLMGYCTRDEARRAVTMTKKVSGIKRIVTIFDYMDSPSNPAPKLTSQQSQPSVSSAGGTNSSSSMAAETQGSADNGGAAILGEDNDLLAPATPANW